MRIVTPTLVLFLAACGGGDRSTPAGSEGDGDPEKEIVASMDETEDDQGATNATTGETTVSETTPAAESVDPAVSALDDFIASQDIDKNGSSWKVYLPKPPQVDFTDGATYLWKLTTSKGDVIVKLLPDTAPMHVSSTIYLTRLGFYDDLKFHRIIPDFMAQGGCPIGTGTGGPGYKYAGEFPADGPKHDKPGLLSMANAGPNTDGSQFFLTFVETPWLDGKHTIFGEVIDGMGTLTALESVGSPGGATRESVKIVKAAIEVQPG